MFECLHMYFCCSTFFLRYNLIYDETGYFFTCQYKFILIVTSIGRVTFYRRNNFFPSLVVNVKELF